MKNEPEVYWLVRCDGGIPDYSVAPAVAGRLALELIDAEKLVAAGGPATWLEFQSTLGGRVRLRSSDIACLEEWTPAVRAYVEQREQEQREREKREDWRG